MVNNSSEKIIRELLSSAGVEINGPNPWDIQVHDRHIYDRVLRDAALGLGESYMEGWWDSESLDQFFEHILLAHLEEKVKGNWSILLHGLWARIFNFQSIKRAFEVGEKVYDVGNDLYKLMLDKRLLYTCAYWKNADNLDDAQEAKLDLVCKKINLMPGMSVLELGCGWGGFAKFAAERYGAKVLGLTVSKEQLVFSNELCRGLPVELKLQDYRMVEGKFDRVVSIGMMEHVGYKNYRAYMQMADRCLKDDGIAFVHTIGANTSRFKVNPWTDKYIFPNGMIPSISQLGKSMEKYFVMEDWHNFGPDYDKTLMAWHANFEKTWPQLKDKYGERFYRMWRYYLLACAGGFRSRSMQLWQIVMTKPGRAQPNVRFS